MGCLLSPLPALFPWGSDPRPWIRSVLNLAGGALNLGPIRATVLISVPEPSVWSWHALATDTSPMGEPPFNVLRSAALKRRGGAAVEDA
jgi:hypothetical protein